MKNKLYKIYKKSFLSVEFGNIHKRMKKDNWVYVFFAIGFYVCPFKKINVFRASLLNFEVEIKYKIKR